MIILIFLFFFEYVFNIFAIRLTEFQSMVCGKFELESFEMVSVGLNSIAFDGKCVDGVLNVKVEGAVIYLI